MLCRSLTAQAAMIMMLTVICTKMIIHSFIPDIYMALL